MTHAQERKGIFLAVAALLLIALASTLLIYSPWRHVPFDIVDFSEFLPLLQRPTIGRRWSGFIHYYASQGRWNVLAYAGLIFRWSLFGSNTAGWQLARFVELWFIIAAVFMVLRRFGADCWGAAAGAGLFMVAGVAVWAWLRLTMGEPLGLFFLLPALFIAAGYRQTRHWRRDAILIAIWIGLALLTKEILVAFVPFVVIIGCCLSGPARLDRPHNDDRTRWLTISTTVAVVAVLLPVLLVAHSAPSGNFASQYTVRRLSLSRSLDNLSVILLPAGQARPNAFISRFTASANVLYLTILATGVLLLWQRGPERGISRRQVIAWGALAVLLPISAVVAYEPWLVFQDFYGFPFLFGAAMLIAAAVTATNLLAPRWSIAIGGAYLAMIAIAGIRAEGVRASYFARREVNGAVAGYLAAHAPGKAVVVVAHGFSGSHWPGTGPALGRYVAAVHPEITFGAFQDDTTCALPPRNALAGDHVIVSYADDCGTYPHPSATFESRYRYLTLHPPAWRPDSLRIDICDTGSACGRVSRATQ